MGELAAKNPSIIHDSQSDTFMKNFLLFGILAISCLLPVKTYGTHVMGADITYTCDSAYAYTFTITYYRYCGGVSFSNPSSQTRLVNQTTGATIGISLSLQSITDVTPTCKTVSPRCYPTNQRSGDGIEAHVYTCSVDFKKSPYKTLLSSGNCAVRLETAQCCRNSNITTGAANANFYTYALLDVCKAPVNNSPQFKFPPVAFLCCNQPIYYMIGGFDHMDFDSLSYEFAHPLSGWSQNIKYNGSYAYNNPFVAYYPGTLKFPYNNPNASPPIGLYLNEKDGSLIFTPIKCGERTVAVIEVKEWRKDTNGKYEVIGITRRDLQYYTQQCPDNNPPQIKGNFSSTIKIQPCNERYCVQIKTEDDIKKPPPPQKNPPPDTVSFVNLDLPAGVTMKVLDPDSINPTAELCFDFSILDRTKFTSNALTIPVMVKDNACPLNAVSVRSFAIKVDTSSFFGRIKGQVIEDKNGNCIQNSGEGNFEYVRKVGFNGSNKFYKYSNTDGSFELCLDTGSQKIQLVATPWYDDLCTSKSLNVEKDSTHKVDFFSRLYYGIAGYVYSDEGSCKIDSGASPIAGQMVVAQPGDHYAITDSKGFYLLKVKPGKYKVSLVNDTTLWTNRCADTITANLGSNTTLFVDTFINYQKVTQEVAVKMGFNSGSNVRKGTDCRGVVNVFNNGQYSIDKTVVTVKTVSGLVDLSKSTGGWSNPSAGVYQITVSNLNPGKRLLSLYLKTGTGYNTGDSIPFVVYTDSTIINKDIKPTNNIDSTWLRVVSPYDPNRKTATPDSIFTTIDRKLYYNVEFQNEGTATAIDVVIRDTLPEELDLTTLQFLESSHNFTYALDGNNLWIYFTNINLPTKSASDIYSIGNVSFSIELKEDIEKETFIKNRVGIYFDLEDVVLTNYQVNHFKSPIELIDTTIHTYCPEDSLSMPFVTNFTPNQDNWYILEVTDSSGNNTTFTTLDSINSKLESTKFVVPLLQRLGPGDHFKFRIRSTSPKTICFEEEYRQTAVIKPKLHPVLSLNNTTLCYGSEVTIETGIPGVLNKLMVNGSEVAQNATGKFKSDTFGHQTQIFIEHVSSDGCIYQSDTSTLNVLAVPSVSMTVDSVFCQGSTAATFSKKVSYGKGLQISDSIVWNFGDGSSEMLKSSDPDPSHNYGTGSYTAMLFVHNDICSDSASSPVHFNVQPTASFTLPSNSICMNQEFGVYHTSTTSLGMIDNVLWDFNDGTTSTDSALKHTYATDGSHNIALIVVDNFGCSDTLLRTMQIIKAPTASISPDKIDACIYDANFKFNSTILGDYVSKQWIVDGNTFSTDSILYTFATAGVYNVDLIALSSGVCHDTASVSVEVYDVEQANFDIPSEVCDDDVLSLSSTTSQPTSAYGWNVANTNLTGASTSLDLSTVPAGDQSVRLLITTEHGCMDSISKPLTITVRPSVSYIADEVCLPSFTTFEITPINNKTNTLMNVIWGDGQETGLIPVQTQIKYQYVTAGTYSSKMTIETGICKDSSDLNVNVFAKPNADFEIVPDKTEGDKFVFNNTSVLNSRNLWNIDGVTFIEDNSPSIKHQFDKPGTYLVTLIVETNDGCSDTISKSLLAATDVIFYIPNAFSPNKDGLNDTFNIVPSEYISEINFSLYNRWGEKVVSSDDPANLIPEPLPNGLYMYTAYIVDLYGKKYTFNGTVNIW